MFDSTLPFIATALLLAGFVKGAMGLGLPTVAMGLLAVSMPPAQAIAIVIVPAIVTKHLADLRWTLFSRHHPAAMAVADRDRRGHLAERRVADRSLCTLYHNRARPVAGAQCHHCLSKLKFQHRPPKRKMGGRHCRRYHRHGFRRYRRAGDSSVPFLQAIAWRRTS